MIGTSWKNSYNILRIIFCFWLVVLPFPFIIFPPIIMDINHMMPNNRWAYSLWIGLILIALGCIVVTYGFIKVIIMSKFQLEKIYKHLSLSQISLIVEDALKKNNIPFIVDHDIIKKGFVNVPFDLCYKTSEGGFEINIQKYQLDKNAVRMILQYSNTSNKDMINLTTDEIDKRVIGHE